MKRSNILMLTILPFLFYCSFKGQNDDIVVNIEKEGKNQIILVFKNTSQKKYILPNILLSGNILKFKNAPEVNFNGTMVDREYPHHFDKEAIDFDEFTEKECYLNDTVNYRVVLPNHSFSLKYNVNDNYEGLNEGKNYMIQYRFNIDKEYSDYCPLILNGTIESNTIVW